MKIKLNLIFGIFIISVICLSFSQVNQTKTSSKPSSQAIAKKKPVSINDTKKPSSNIATTPIKTVSNKPIIKFIAIEHDFGEINEGEEAKWDFEFVNEGKTPLILQNVKPSCSCTAPEWPKTPILYNQNGKITAVYGTDRRPGPFNKTLTVSSNADNGEIILTIKGFVKATITTEQKSTPNEFK
jgi:hypothetical protein